MKQADRNEQHYGCYHHVLKIPEWNIQSLVRIEVVGQELDLANFLVYLIIARNIYPHLSLSCDHE